MLLVLPQVGFRIIQIGSSAEVNQMIKVLNSLSMPAGIQQMGADIIEDSSLASTRSVMRDYYGNSSTASLKKFMSEQMSQKHYYMTWQQTSSDGEVRFIASCKQMDISVWLRGSNPVRMTIKAYGGKGDDSLQDC